jgi:hypothetical protein
VNAQVFIKVFSFKKLFQHSSCGAKGRSRENVTKQQVWKGSILPQSYFTPTDTYKFILKA